MCSAPSFIIERRAHLSPHTDDDERSRQTGHLRPMGDVSTLNRGRSTAWALNSLTRAHHPSRAADNSLARVTARTAFSTSSSVNPCFG
mmetsp:Transcript_41982/g.84252  ORF Transcript_41982/g.84252 Transcript_41982/m.84252 type:complete len:88 (-) Transcript_41982:538-801(-)